MSAGADPSLLSIQPGLTWKINDNTVLKTSVNIYEFNSLKGLPVSNITGGSGTNSTSGSPAAYKYDYDSVGLSAELGLNLQKDPDSRELVNYLGFFGDYIHNPDPSTANTGYLFGTTFGDKKIKDAGMWQAKVLYRKMEKDAWVDFLSDSDFLGGDTNAKGYELIFNYGLAKNVEFGLDYYSSQTLTVASGANKEKQSVLQVDCVLKF